MTMRSIVAVVLAGLLWSGCTPARHAVRHERPATLDQVNRQLEGRAVRIETIDGRVIRAAREVRLDPASATWRSHPGAPLQQLPTFHIRRISYRPLTPASVVLPAAALLGLAVAIAAYRRDKANCSEAGCVGVELARPWYGVFGLGGGTLAGAGLHGAVRPRRVTVYEAPLERYLHP